jgi:hypothetical protein
MHSVLECDYHLTSFGEDKMRKLGLAILLGLILAYTLSPIAQARLPSRQDVTVKNGPGADNAAIQAAINQAGGKPITILLHPGSREAGTCYSIAGPIDLASNVTIDSTSPPSRWCMQRATPPRDPNSPEQRWFKVLDNAVNNFKMRNANLYGRGPGGVSFEDQESFVDIGLQFSIRAPQSPSEYSKNLTLRHVTFDKFYGTCVFLRYVNGLSFDDVVCNDPTKGGLIFTGGTRNGIIKNSVSTLTGDDAMAFTSANDAGGALVTNFDVQNAHLTQEQDDRGCGTLCFRGADDIVTTNSDIGAGSGVGTVNFIRSADPAHQFSSTNIKISSTIIKPDADENGVSVRDPGASNIRITNNSIYYTPPQCGIRLYPITPDFEITTSPNDFHPDDELHNVCGQRLRTVSSWQ